MDPFFLRGEMTPEQVAYMFEWEEGKTVYTQKTVEASVSGSLFELPAGPVAVALAINGREDRINDVPRALTRSGNAWDAPPAGINPGTGFTKEDFAAHNTPLQDNPPFYPETTLPATARVTTEKATTTSEGPL